MLGSEAAKDIPATTADWLLSLKTGKRTISPTLQGAGSGAIEGSKAAADILIYGIDPEEAIAKWNPKSTNFGDGVVGRTMKLYTDVVFRGLGAQDKVFWHSSFARSLYDQAGAEAMNAGKTGNKAFIQKSCKKSYRTNDKTSNDRC